MDYDYYKDKPKDAVYMSNNTKRYITSKELLAVV